MKKEKKRLDVLLVERGLASSREKAKALIMAGIVYVNNNKEDTAVTLTNSSRFTESIQLTKLCNQGVFAFSGGLQIPLQRERGSAWEHPNPRELENSPAGRALPRSRLRGRCLK